MSITRITLPSWLLSHTVLLYKKEDPITLDNYRPITLAIALYKLWTTCIVMLATDHVESRKIPAPNKKALEQTARARETSNTSIFASKMPTYTKRTSSYVISTSKGLYPQPISTS